MRIKTLDELVGFYVKLGYVGFKLKSVIEKDKRYAQLLKKRKDYLTKIGVSSSEQKKYVLLTGKDIEILRRCNRLEKNAGQDADIIKLIKSQLEEDWRRPLLKKLKALGKKCR
ncbi:MAG: hypothetical protein J4400_04745 [Candidatus Aenigmarchaeota archaeon]|nr:hypothetical protein [Candidatus Aenigmarchaeota archaeon]